MEITLRSLPVIDIKSPRPGSGQPNPFLFRLPQDFEYTGGCFADVVPEFLDRFALRIASRKGGDLSPNCRPPRHNQPISARFGVTVRRVSQEHTRSFRTMKAGTAIGFREPRPPTTGTGRRRVSRPSVVIQLERRKGRTVARVNPGGPNLTDVAFSLSAPAPVRPPRASRLEPGAVSAFRQPPRALAPYRCRKRA